MELYRRRDRQSSTCSPVSRDRRSDTAVGVIGDDGKASTVNSELSVGEPQRWSTLTATGVRRYVSCGAT